MHAHQPAAARAYGIRSFPGFFVLVQSVRCVGLRLLREFGWAVRRPDLCQKFWGWEWRADFGLAGDRRVCALSQQSYGRSNRNLRRSEEHTSELQSLTNLVCRLLLEKKKNDNEGFVGDHYNVQTA